jgi:signal recognition particle receptor subunit beta
MVLFNYSTKELTAKVVYYGPGLCGKTTNLQWIHDKVPIKNKGKMLSLATETDRTLFFDFLPIEIGTIRGMRTRIQLYTVPGQVFYNATRRMVLKGADCLVFVVDSQEPMLDASIESFENLRQNLEANEIDAEQIPMVLQYNKRDLPNALPIEILNERMNPHGYPFYEAVAVKGIGVEETLKGVTKLVFKSLAAKYGEPGVAPPPTPARTATNPAVGSPPRQVPAPSATIPPGSPRLVPQSPEELLDGLDLTPPALEVEAAPPALAASSLAQAQARSTLVAEADEAEELRRQIKGPISPDYEVNLEEISPPEAMEELTLDSEPLPTFEPEGEPDAEPTMAPMTLDEPEPEDLPPLLPTPLPVRQAPAPVSPPVRVRAAEPAPLVIEVEAGRSDVVLPIELNIEPGVEQVSVNLRLVFNIRR